MKEKRTLSSISPMIQRLFAALEQRDEGLALTALASALADGADPNATGRFDWEPFNGSVLEAALCLDQPWAPRLALALLDAGANPLTREGSTPALVIAARYGRPETVRALLDRGHSARVATAEGWTPFLCAAAKGNFELCEFLAPLSNTEASAEDGCEEMRVDAAFLFINNKAPELALRAYERGWGDPGRVANSHWTPLIHAVQDQADELVAYLAGFPQALKAGSGKAQRTAMHYAVMGDDGGRPDYVRILAQAGHALDGLDEDGVSPLTLAFLHKSEACVNALLASGADPAARLADPALATGSNAEKFSGMDALLAAISSETLWAFEMASSFANRCDRAAKTFDDGAGSLHYAATLESPELSEHWTRLLLDLGWSPRAVDNYNQPALMQAMGRENYETMDLLIPVSDLSCRSELGLDVFEVGEWLAKHRKTPGPLEKLLSHLERTALSEEVEATVLVKRPRAL